MKGIRLVAALVVLTSIVSCARDESSAIQAPVADRSLAAVSAAQAGAAVSDAMLATSYALYLGITHAPGTHDVTTPDGRLRLSWSDDADFVSGSGTYTVTLNGFSIPPDDPFAANYHGYTLSGTTTIVSRDGSSTAITIEMSAKHDAPARFPAAKLNVQIGGERDTVRVNGREFALEDLASTFQTVGQ